MRLASQSAYPDLVRATYNAGALVTVTMTAGYLGATPAEWELSVPDLSSVSGFKSEWALHTGSFNPMQWTVDAWATRAPIYFGCQVGNVGETFRCAHVQSSASFGALGDRVAR